MVSRQTNESDKTPRRRPASTPEGRENQLISDAFALAEKQIQEGIASAQVITHFLKLGSSREKIEQQKLKLENEYLEAKAEDLRNRASTEALYRDAIAAFRSYGGHAAEPQNDSQVYED
jgi:hypothetical protein